MLGTNKRYLAAVAALLAVPLGLAHSDGGVYGTPKSYCEDVVGATETAVHDYVSNTGHLLSGGSEIIIGGIGSILDEDAPAPDATSKDLPVRSPNVDLGSGLDGSTPPCPYDPQWDGHFEWADGGAWLLACESACANPYGTEGDGSLVCWETYADHDVFPDVWVFDHTLSSAGVSVSFFIAANFYNNVPQTNPGPQCGDFEADHGQGCVDHCKVDFPPGLDGSYYVFVQGTFGHVWST